ncbi:histone deacetylase [Gemmatimonadota bacterium]
MKIFYSDRFVLPLPPDHRFPMAKYALLRERVAASRLGGPHALQVPPKATDEELTTVHDHGYVRKVEEGRLTSKEVRRMGFPWSPELAERSRRSVGGTLAASRAALEDGVAVNLSGGTHHAFPDRGEGFCVFNDVAVAARVMQGEGLARRVAILDLDVHQGNGTAAVFRRDPTVFTLSVHGANNFPFQKEESDLDVELPDGTGDAIFLEAVGAGLREALQEFGADFALFLAGADPYEGDRLGRLCVTREGLAERDHMVMEACREATAPVAVVMGGGYAPSIDETVEIHLATVRIAGGFHSGEGSGRPRTPTSPQGAEPGGSRS